MNSASKEIDTVGKVTLDLSEIYNDLLKSDQNGSSLMLNIPFYAFLKTFSVHETLLRVNLK